MSEEAKIALLSLAGALLLAVLLLALSEHLAPSRLDAPARGGVGGDRELTDDTTGRVI